MNTLTRLVLAQCIFLYAVLAHSAADPDAAIAECRAKYAEQPAEHIACLERGLHAMSAPRQEAKPPSLGAEQLRTKPSQDAVEQASVQIENVTYGFDGMAVFRLTDGQVWKATDSTPEAQRLEPGKHYTGRIERGALSGYRMYVEGAPRMIRVKRLQ